MSEEIDGEIHIDEVEASGGSKEGVVRWVLLISLLSAILVLSIIWITGAVMADDAATDAGYEDSAVGDDGGFPPLEGMDSPAAPAEEAGTTDAAPVADEAAPTDAPATQ